ncbi:GreA/GreB family elongation factor [Photobacterium aphoticum]|uniref:GreA/GreB family elongation factor n=1 Tax=Photobacterium aphoticum TaxID=754436 RepID=UPI000ABFFF1C|nr:GreA/GreB family elongation factor [Photobacterium aphoticum]GHA63666.1 transcription elongation factor [Photobacterium aphoticum]
MNIDKQQVVAQILEQLHQAYQGAVAAADRAHSTATDDENAPETQYDTLALEAAYLAHGQSQRVAECMADVTAYQKLQASLPTTCTQVVLGCLVQLVDEHDQEKTVFFGPSAGGIRVAVNGQEIVVVTPTSPFGEALLGLEVDDEAEVVLGHATVMYDIVAIA